MQRREGRREGRERDRGASDEKKSGLSAETEHLDFETSEDVTVVHTFDDMGLKEPLLRGIYGFGV